MLTERLLTRFGPAKKKKQVTRKRVGRGVSVFADSDYHSWWHGNRAIQFLETSPLVKRFEILFC